MNQTYFNLCLGNSSFIIKHAFHTRSIPMQTYKLHIQLDCKKVSGVPVVSSSPVIPLYYVQHVVLYCLIEKNAWTSLKKMMS